MPSVRARRLLTLLAVSGLAAMAAAEPQPVFASADHGAVTFEIGSLEQNDVAFTLPGGEQVVGTVTDRDVHSESSFSWQGTLDAGKLGNEPGWFSVSSSGGVAHAAIWAGDLGVYELRYRGDASGLYDMVRVDTIDFPSCAGPVLPDAQQRGIPGLRAQAEWEQTRTTTASRGGDDGSVIDVMIVYTAQARNGWGGTNAIEALAQNSINVTNTAYANSNIGPLELRLVHTYEVNYSETGSASADLTAIRSTNDGEMDEVHQLRDQYGADLVAMLVNSFNACGIGYLSPFNSAFGFTVTDTGCAVGNLSFPHEIGHNMGTTHDRGNGTNSQFSYGYGWRWNGTNGTQYRSVMAYSPGSRVPYFSNPDINYVGTPTGTVNDDNARVHDETRFSVAQFRQSLPELSFSFPNGLPTMLVEGETTTIAVDIEPGSDGPLNPATAIMFYGYDVPGQPFQFAPLVNTSGQIWEADLPAGDCGQIASFYFTITNTDAQEFTSPENPAMPYTAAVTDCSPACVADTNADGLLTPADFNAWILAFNNNDPACDQNSDAQCTPADFNAWILNYNAGC